jgi:hypothetical protein
MNAQAIPTSPQQRRPLATGTAASLLLHAAAVVLLFLNLSFDPPPEAPRETTVEVLLIPEKADLPPQPSTEETKQAEAVIPDLPVTERPPPPQLKEAPLAERSIPLPGPPRERPSARTGTESKGPSPVPAPSAPPAPRAPRAELSTGGGAGVTLSLPREGGEEKARQDEKDFLLAQVLPFWLLNYKDPRYQHVVFRGHFVLRADGMLDPPFGKNDPWLPEVMIGGYDRLLGRQHEPQRLAIESFLRAVRAAQPFRLQPGVDSYPRQVPVFFRLGDLG